MAKQRTDPEIVLRAWVDALNAAADLQHAIVEEAEKSETAFGMKWLDSYRAIVFGALTNFPEGVAPDGSVQGLKKAATDAITRLQEEVRQRKLT